jgi:hypothetical protein
MVTISKNREMADGLQRLEAGNLWVEEKWRRLARRPCIFDGLRMLFKFRGEAGFHLKA